MLQKYGKSFDEKTMQAIADKMKIYANGENLISYQVEHIYLVVLRLYSLIL